MSELDIIIPVKNEAENVRELFERLDKSLTKAGIDYRAIFVDDYSTDETAAKIKELEYGNGKFTNGKAKPSLGRIIYDANLSNPSNGEPQATNASKIKLLSKRGKTGKAFAILEGAKAASASYVVMIDGDLQYPPEVIPEMYERVRKNGGVVVANRKAYNASFLRKLGTWANILLFEKFLFDLDCDAQSGLKIFKKEIIDELTEDEVTGWTLDAPLLTKAKKLGYHIETVDIEFSERYKGESKVNFLRTSFEIAKSNLALKFKKEKIQPIKPERSGVCLGRGLVYKGKKFVTHSGLSPSQSAIETFANWQKVVLIGLCLLTSVGLFANPIYTGIFLLGILSLIYFSDIVFTFYTLSKNLNGLVEIKISKRRTKNLQDSELPIYSVLCPLYKEGNVLSHFIAAIKKLDWPKEKLDVLLLLEEDDKDTLGSVQSLNLPQNFRVLVVPNSAPKTKPKACNYGLAFAKGEYVVVYDAEDKPDPLQLKKAYLSFKDLPKEVVCLQSKLNYYNPHQNILTRLFTTEYSLWFDLILPGLQSVETTIPLGGTSNHFKVSALRFLDAWDPFNVTEDCDLGARLFKSGFRTAIIDSTTYEEANSELSGWLRQRSRWIKGYMQTYLVHMRNPLAFIKRHGIHALYFQLVIGARMTFMVINPILWFMTASYFAFNKYTGVFIESLYPAGIYYFANATLVFGNFMYFYVYMIGCAKRDRWELMKYVFLVPFYWFLMSLAALKAFYQLMVRPYYWEKTQHGLHLERKKAVRLPSININLEFETSFNFGFVGKLLTPFATFIFLAKNIVDFIDLVWPLPQNGGPKNGGLRILIFNWRDTKHVWSGGAEVYIHEVAKRWVSQGHKVTLFCGWDGKSRRNEIIEGVEIVRRGGFYTVYLFAFLYYLLRFRGKYDAVVDCENGIPFFTPLFVGEPKFLLIHHVHQEVFRRHLPAPLSTLAVFMESRLMPSVYKGVPFVTISDSSKLDIVRRGWTSQENVKVVHPGIDLLSFRPVPKTTYPSFVYLGRLKPWKNVDIAILAFREVLRKHPSAKLTIAGFGESLPYLQKLATKLDIQESVVFAGRVSEEEKARFFGESWAAIQPSSYEGWGITVIEANATKTPVIASNIKGLRDSVVDGKTGILFSEKDTSELAKAIETLISNEALRLSLCEEAYEWARRFDWDYSAQQFIETITRAIKGEALPAYRMAVSHP